MYGLINLTKAFTMSYSLLRVGASYSKMSAFTAPLYVRISRSSAALSGAKSSRVITHRRLTTAVLKRPTLPDKPAPTAENEEDLCFVDECTERYRLPPPEIVRLVDANADPVVSLQPASKDWILFLERPNLPPIAELASEELRLAGFRINATTFAPSRAQYFLGMHLQRVEDTSRTEVGIKGLPDLANGLQIGYVRWSPDGTKIAFCTYEPMFGLQLWCVDAATWEARCVLKGKRLNAVCGEPFTWNSDSRTILAKFVVEDQVAPKKSPVPRGPIVQENMSRRPAPSRTFQDLLKDPHDVAMFEHYTTCQLGRVDVVESTMTPLGLPAAFRHASPSPDGNFVLIDIMVPPYPYMIPAGRFPRRVEVWNIHTGEEKAIIADIPLQENIKVAFDAVGEGPRSIAWRSDVASTIYWVEAQDEGDPDKDVPIRDCMFTLPAPFTGSPRKLVSFPWRYSGVIWGNVAVALVSERKYDKRSRRTYRILPGPCESTNTNTLAGSAASPMGPCCARACDLSQGEAPKRLMIDIPNWEDRYNFPGNPVMERNKAGKTILRMMHSKQSRLDETLTSDGKSPDSPLLLLQGAGASVDGDRPFLSAFDTLTGTQTRLWNSAPPYFEMIAAVLKEDPQTGLLKSVLIRRETKHTNPNFYLLDLEETVKDVIMNLPSSSTAEYTRLSSALPASSARGELRPVTTFAHPAPELVGVEREIVEYNRRDGVRLTGDLYLPPGYSKKMGPLPVLIWAYPREFKSAAFAGQTRGSPYQFVRLARTPLYWLTQGYAVLDGPEMPIIGEGDTEPNDTFVEQLVMSAEAAVDYLVTRGVADRERIAIGGHSYGAFMTVNLLAHAPKLFCCGIARSGAYNRTLTPFGFQGETRSLWDAPTIYNDMSPFNYAHNITSPVLLTHGEDDDNSGTHLQQSTRLYQALKGHGKRARFVLLPRESHGYRGRESVLHVLAEMTDWLNRWCKRELPSEKRMAEEVELGSASP